MIDFSTKIYDDLPVFNSSTDKNREIFVKNESTFYIGCFDDDLWIPRGLNVLKLQAGESITIGNVVYLTGNNTVSKADADLSNCNPIGIAMTSATIGNSVYVFGNKCIAYDVLVGATPGQIYYLSQTSGALTTTNLIGTANVIQIGIAKNSTDLIINIKTDTMTGIKSGTIVMWPDENIPNGWLECDGSDLDSSEYQALYAILGTKFGSGDGGDNDFNLPDLRGVFIKGWDNGKGRDLYASEVTLNGTFTNGSNIITNVSGGVLSDVLIGSYINENSCVVDFAIITGVSGNTITLNTNAIFTSTRNFGVSNRYDRGDGTFGDHVGTYQHDGFSEHLHSYNDSTFQISSNISVGYWYIHGEGTSASSYTFDSDTDPGGKENRPKNISMMYIIKI